jgi:hypothetical protein
MNLKKEKKVTGMTFSELNGTIFRVAIYFNHQHNYVLKNPESQHKRKRWLNY